MRARGGPGVTKRCQGGARGLPLLIEGVSIVDEGCGGSGRFLDFDFGDFGEPHFGAFW